MTFCCDLFCDSPRVASTVLYLMPIISGMFAKDLWMYESATCGISVVKGWSRFATCAIAVGCSRFQLACYCERRILVGVTVKSPILSIAGIDYRSRTNDLYRSVMPLFRDAHLTECILGLFKV